MALAHYLGQPAPQPGRHLAVPRALRGEEPRLRRYLMD
jgi:hypothetical protein